jgi:phage baseplate assembly protein W
MGGHLAYPYRVTLDGVTATTPAGPAHVRQMLEQLLFTAPGERVNHPDFGCGLLELVFEPTSTGAVAGLAAVVRANVQQWLGDVLELTDVAVTPLTDVGSPGDGGLDVSVTYAVRADGQPATDVFTVAARTGSS